MRIRGTRPEAEETHTETKETSDDQNTTSDKMKKAEKEVEASEEMEQDTISKANSETDKDTTVEPVQDAESDNQQSQTAPAEEEEETKVAGSEKSQDSGREPGISDEELKPFDFQRFLDQLRHKSADPIARYVKSFLHEFNKRPWTTNEQIKIVGDFRVFISSKMQLCPQFANLNDNGWRNAQEGMEKLIMNRLYPKTFSPEIPQAMRDGSHEEDVLRDHVLEEKMRIWHWVQGRHLDIPERFLRNGDSFVRLASDELTKINHYRAPRDKMICILNCCKVIFGLLRQSKSEESADGFLPILIYIVLKAQPKNLISNVNYIQRFRDPERLNGEAGYYLSSLVGAVAFLETLDRSRLSISDDEFEANVEQSVKSIAEKRSKAEERLLSQPPDTPERKLSPRPPVTAEAAVSETTAAQQPAGTETETSNTEAAGASTSAGASAGGSASEQPAGGTETPTGMNASTVLMNSAGLLAAPFKSLSRMFEADPNEETSTAENSDAEPDKKPPHVSPEELAARQVSAEEHEAQRIYREEFVNVTATFRQMFPKLDQEIIEDVLREKEGRVGPAVDACLALLST